MPIAGLQTIDKVLEYDYIFYSEQFAQKSLIKSKGGGEDVL
jgi:hypothetical protein